MPDNTMGQFLKRVMVLREKMIELQLYSANTKCVCERGRIEAVLRGHKKHIHAQCSACKRVVMQ
jgi:hypothetical protein